jgi:pyrroline-5-carboxylate reductase
MKKRIGIIGFGNMGSAIAQRIKTRHKVFVFDADRNKTKRLKNINVSNDISKLASSVDVIILAVKPQDLENVLQEIKDYVNDKLIVSVAAGKETAYIEKALGNVRVIRVMPNIEIIIGRGIVFICKGEFAEKKDVFFVRSLFNCMSKAMVIDEDKINAATAVTGSRLAYFCAEIEKNKIDYRNIPQAMEIKFKSDLKQAAKGLGFDDGLAETMSIGAGSSCEILFKTKHMTPEELRKKITSKKGTTEAALNEFHKSGSWTKAVKAAVKRAKELSKN